MTTANAVAASPMFLVTYQVVRCGVEFRHYQKGQTLRARVKPEDLERFLNRVTAEGAVVLAAKRYYSRD